VSSSSSSSSWSGQFNGELMWSVDAVSHLNDPARRVISTAETCRTDGERGKIDRRMDGWMDGWPAAVAEAPCLQSSMVEGAENAGLEIYPTE